MKKDYEGRFEHEYSMAIAEGYGMPEHITWKTPSPARPYRTAEAAVTAGRIAGVKLRRADAKLVRAYASYGKGRKRIEQGRYLEAMERLAGSGALKPKDAPVVPLGAERSVDLTPSDEKAIEIAKVGREAGLW